MMNTEQLALPNIYYIFKIDHRNGNPDKSQWSISESMEISCFQRAYASWRCSPNNCWGLHLEKDKVAYLGITKSSAPEERRLFVAKFINGNKNNRWHGYPADHVLHHQDIPPEDVLARWLQAQYLRPAVVRKLSRGQKCKL